MTSTVDNAQTITITNSSLENLVFVLYRAEDTLQVQGCHKFNIMSSASVTLPYVWEKSRMLHIFRPGLMGMISLRTRLSSGYGFPVHPEASYRVNVIERDANGSWVSFERELEGEQYIPISPTPYHFGDMIIRPVVDGLAHGGMALLRGLDSNMYKDWRYRSSSRRVCSAEGPADPTPAHPPGPDAPPPAPTACCASPPAPPPAPLSSIPERELWGVFFGQVYEAGVWALQAGLLSPDEVQEQEAFLFIGLPAVSLCNAVLRSVGAGEKDTLVLVDGRRIAQAVCPPSFEAMLGALLATCETLHGLPPLSPLEMDWLRAFLLVAGSDRVIPGVCLNCALVAFTHCFLTVCAGEEGLPEERKSLLRGAFSQLVGVSTSVTQLDFFKSNFLSVLEHLESWSP